MNRRTLLICLAALLSAACQKHQTAERKPVAVKTVAAELTATSNEVRYSGIVEPDTQVDLAFRVAGYVERIGVVRDATGRSRELEEGDFVAAGTVLARLRPAEYQTRVNYAQAVAADAAASLNALEAQLSEAEAALVQATRDFDRARSLFAEKALTKVDFDAAEARHNTSAARRDATAAQITAQKARIEGAGAQHKEASISLGDTAITAPFPAVVIAKKIARGSLVGAGTPAFVIADTRIAKVSFGVPDLALASFKPGDTLTVTAEAVPDREFRGRVASIAPAADPATRVFSVDIAIPNAGQLLKVGMVSSVVVAGVKDATPSPSIPLAAVVKAPNGYGVYTIENERVRLQPVSLGPVRGNAVMITAGIQPGQLVVSAAGLQLAEGERVQQIP